MNVAGKQNPTASGKYYDPAMGLIRVIAAFFVVLLHVGAQGAYDIVGAHWLTAIAYDSFTRICVPLFFMLSGALMIPRMEPGIVLFRSIVKRLLLPYIAWSVIYMLYNHLTGVPVVPLWKIFTTPAYFHLTFMLQLLAVYLSFPLLRGFWNNPQISRGMKRYVIGAALLSGVFCEFLPQLIGTVVQH